MTSVYNIVVKAIKDVGADGLFNKHDGCSCGLDNFQPCGEMSASCEIAKKSIITQEDIDAGVFIESDEDVSVGDGWYRPISTKEEHEDLC